MDDQTTVGSPGTAPKKFLAGHEPNEFAWSVLDGLPTASIVCEAAEAGLRVIYHNPRFRELLQLPDDVIAGATLSSLVEDGVDAGDQAKLQNPTEESSIRCELAPGVIGTLRLRPHATVANYWIGSLEPLRVSEASRGILETLFNASRNLVTAKDTEGRYVMVNSAFAEFVDQPIEDVLGRTRVESHSTLPRLPRRTATRLSKAEQEAIRSARPMVERGKRIADANGRDRVFDIVRTPVLNENGEVQFLIGVASDSTDTEYWTYRYQTQRDLLAHLMDAVPDPIWVGDRAGKLVLKGPGRWIIEGAEALVRWKHDEYGLLYPDSFLPLAEESGLITNLTDFVFRAAMEQARVWFANGLYMELAVNLSAQFLTDLEFPDRLLTLIKENNLDPSMLTLELTETTAVADAEVTMDILARLRVRNIKLSIDDFGTGFSSLTHLYQMPFSELKIDNSFIRDMQTNPDARAMVEALIYLAHKLKISVCAEGVENEHSLRRLEEMHCDAAQGYLIGDPVNAKQLRAWWRIGTAGIGCRRPTPPNPPNPQRRR
jgi:PAS domain S-box-containing protein